MVDTTDPVLSGVPTNTTVECDSVPSAASPTASDNCDTDVTIDYAEVRTDGDCFDSYLLTRIWTATDSCGNSASQTQLVTVVDTTDPVLSGVPADTTVECDAVPAAAIVTVADSCDDAVEVELLETEIELGLGEYKLVRVWTAVDSCQNSTSATQTINVVDTTTPAISDAPPNVTVECDAVPSPATLTASDNCSEGITVQFEESRQEGDCSGRYTLVRVWVATDMAGNSTGVTQVVTVQDTTSPEITAGPSAVSVTSTNEVPPADTALIIASDLCGTVGVIHMGDVTNSGSGSFLDPQLIERTYRAEDECGNFTNYLQVISVIAPEPIVITEMGAIFVGTTMSVQFTTADGLRLMPQYATELVGQSTIWVDITTTHESYTNGVYLFSFDPPPESSSTLYIRIIRVE